MGWSGRSDLQIACIIVFLLLLPIGIAMWLTFRAIRAAKARRGLGAFFLALGSFLCAPIAWSLLELGLFAP
jgi:hypothetical protein